MALALQEEEQGKHRVALQLIQKLGGMRRSAVTLWASGFLALLQPVVLDAQPSEEAKRCATRIERFGQSDVPSSIHTDDDCLEAAAQGYPGIQYSVGMSFGFAGDRQMELLYYLLAAANGYVEAYLAIGHVMRSEPINNIDQAVRWYSLYWEGNGSARGYAAKLLSVIESDRGHSIEAEMWLQRCAETDYPGCD